MTTDPTPVITALIDTVTPIVSMERHGLVIIALGSAATGEETDVRFETDRITGVALVRDHHLVHLEVHRVI